MNNGSLKNVFEYGQASVVNPHANASPTARRMPLPRRTASKKTSAPLAAVTTWFSSETA